MRDARTGQANFTQTVTSPDGAKKKTSSGSFEFARPNRFRFAYTKPFEQLIVADGQKVWIYDTRPEPGQQPQARPGAGRHAGGAAGRRIAGAGLRAQGRRPIATAWPGSRRCRARATARCSRCASAFAASDLAAIEIVDSFGQTSLLQFSQLATNIALAPDRFRFACPPGADVIEQ